MQVIVVAVVASLFVAAVATAADWVWASQLLRHKVLYGLCTAPDCAARWAWRSARRTGGRSRASPAGSIAGVLAAASYYGFVFIPGFRRYAILAAWAVLWILFGYLEGPFLRGAKVGGAHRARRRRGGGVGRGVLLRDRRELDGLESAAHRLRRALLAVGRRRSCPASSRCW